MNNDRPETMNLGQIADRVGRSTSWLRDVRNRDDRFPAPDADGRYDLHAVAIIIGVRALEKMADDDYLTELRHHAREMIAELESARWNFLAGEHRAELVEYLRATLTSGRTALQRAIDGSLERLRQISAPTVGAGNLPLVSAWVKLPTPYRARYATAYIVASNRRRNLTVSHKAIVAARLATLPRGANQHTSKEVCSQSDAATMLGVSVASVQRAAAIQEDR